MDKNNCKNVEKYFIGKKPAKLVLVIVVILLLVYVAMLVLCGLDDIKNKIDILTYDIFLIIKDISLIALTIFAGALISGCLIEKKSNNKVYLDTIINEVLLSKDFYQNLSDDNKKVLEGHITGIEDKEHLEILKKIKEKLFDYKPKFYFSQCSFVVTCKKKEGYIEKVVNKNLRIKSYKEREKIKGFRFIKSAFEEMPDIDNFEVINIMINNKVLQKNEYRIDREKVTENEQTLLKNKYNVREKCIYNKDLILRNSKETKITIRYITRVKEDDDNYVCRVSEHCNKFDLDFTMEGNYKVTGSAFGFVDSAKETPNNTNDNNIKFKFDSWAFRSSGVSIHFKKISN